MAKGRRWAVGAVIVVVALALLAGVVWLGAASAGRHSSATEAPSASSTPTPKASSTPTPTPAGFDKTARSINGPASIWVVSDKRRPLNPVDYQPDDLVYPDVTYVNRQPMRKATATALVAMFSAGQSEAGLRFAVQSAYRSYATQVKVYNGWVQELGQKTADVQSARPGTSEHQTGLAVDISADPAKCTLQACFGQTPQGKWLAANAWRFGFILRYPQGMTPVTGYAYEPWHFRYVGIDLSTEMHRTGVTTLEQFFGLPAAPDYPPSSKRE